MLNKEIPPETALKGDCGGKAIEKPVVRRMNTSKNPPEMALKRRLRGKAFLKKQKPSRKAWLPFSRALKGVEGTTSFGEGRKK